MPTNKQIFNEKMNALASSINTKAGSSGAKNLDQLKTAVDGITPLKPQTKTVTPTTSQQNITPDSNYNGLSQVTVEAVTAAIDADIVAGNIKKDVNILGVVGTYEGTTPTGNQDIDTLNEYNVASKATARVSAAERAKIIPANIKKDITILGVTGTHEGGGTKPVYLLCNGDTITTNDSLYFNTEYNLATVLAQMTYGTDPQTGYSVCWLELGDFYAVDLTSGNYALVWNDGVNIVPIYSTTPVPAFGVTTAGWQVSSFTPTAAVTVTFANIEAHFAAVIDNIVAKDDIAFGIKKKALSVTENGTYSESGTVYTSVSVSVSGGGSQPQLNAPTISFTSGTMDLKIVDPTTNGNFTTGFKIFVDGVETYTTSRTGTTTTYDMSGLSANTAAITVKAAGTNFTDSVESASATFHKYYTVRMYDGETLKQTQSVAYGGMPTYTPTKTGYTFDHWEDSNGNTVTQIAADTDLFAAWVSSPYIAAGVYNVIDNRTSKNNINININFTWKKKTAPSSTATGTALYYKESYGIGMIYCTKNAADSDRMMPYVSSGTDGSRWYPENFMYSENGYYKITVTSDTNVTAEQKAQFDYYFEPFTAT